MGSYIPHPWGQRIYINYLEFFCTGDLSILLHLYIYSITSLYQNGFIDIYFTLLLLIQYYFILLLKIFQLWPLGTFSWLLCPFDIVLSMIFCLFVLFFSISLLFGTKSCSRLTWYTSCRRPRINLRHFILLEYCIRNYDHDTRCAFVTGVSWLLASFSWQSKEIYVYSNLWIYTSINISRGNICTS